MYSRSFAAIATATSLSLALTPDPQALADDAATGVVSDSASATIATTADPDAQADSGTAPTPEEQYQADLAAWKQDLADAEQAVADAEDALATLQSDITQQQSKVDAAQADLDAATQKYEQAKAGLAGLDVSALERAEEEAKAALAAAETAAADAATAAEDAATAKAEAEQRLDEATQERDTKAEELAEIEDSLAEFKDQRSAIEDELADLRHRDETGADYTAEDWKRLASQSIEEMINQYRDAHGMHPLVVHPVFSDQAEAWSEVMARDYEESGDLDAAFRHSDADAWGRSGENIHSQYFSGRDADVNTWDRDTWKSLPFDIFDSWRHSDGHNRNMLNPIYQGMAVGLEVDNTGRIFATTMFFIEDTHYYSTDEMTKAAKDSGSPFYLPSGATEIMRAEALTNPEHNPIEEPEYGDLVRDELDKSSNVGVALDPSVTPVDLSEDIQSAVEKLEFADEVLRVVDERLPEEYEELDRLDTQLDSAAAEHNEATAALEKAKKAAVDANAEVESVQARLTSASEALEEKRAIPREPYEQSLADATVALDQAKSALREARAEADTLAEAQGPARDKAGAARATLEQVRDEEPQAPVPAPAQSETSSETSEMAPTAEPTDEPTSEASSEQKSEQTSDPASVYNPTFGHETLTEGPAPSETAPTQPSTTAAPKEAEDPQETRAPQAPASDDGSSTVGTVLAVIASLLALLAAGIAIAPQLGIDLSKYGITLPGQ